jgi:hypothetical protein
VSGWVKADAALYSLLRQVVLDFYRGVEIAGLNLTDAPSRFVRTRTRRCPLLLAFES